MTVSGTEAGTNKGASRHLFDRPIFIISSPRSGSTLLFETLERAPGLFTTREESHRRIEGISGLRPAERGWTSNRLDARDAADTVVEQLAGAFLADLKDRDGRPPNGRFRMLEKTPKNALRIPFFDAAWPDARYVYLYREPRQTLASMMEAWMSGRFRTYPRLPDWKGLPWSLLLVPGWRALSGLPLPNIVASQWAITTRQILDDLQAIPADRKTAVDYNQLLAAPQSEMKRLADVLDLVWDVQLGESLDLSRATISRPDPEKWRRFEADIEAVLPIVADADARARAFVESATARCSDPT